MAKAAAATALACVLLIWSAVNAGRAFSQFDTVCYQYFGVAADCTYRFLGVAAVCTYLVILLCYFSLLIITDARVEMLY